MNKLRRGEEKAHYGGVPYGGNSVWAPIGARFALAGRLDFHPAGEALCLADSTAAVAPGAILR